MKIPERVVKVSRREKKSLSSRGLKLAEECGELAAEILKYRGEKGAKGKTKKEILKAMQLEAIDCILMGMDILVYTKAAPKEITEVMNSQLDKWEKSFK